MNRSKAFASILLTLVGATTSLAQWSTDPAINLPIGDRTGEQNQPKIRPTSDGGCWISWYDNSAGGYDPYVQRLDATGHEMLPHNGVLIKDTGFSSTQDYDLRVDASNNAVIVFRDDRTAAGGVQVTLQKIAPDGTLLLGTSGLRVSAGTDANNPKCAVLSDGAIAVSWSAGSPGTILMQRVSTLNTLQWASPVVVSEASRTLNNSDIQPAENGNFIILYVRCSGTNCILSNKQLYSQKFDTGGAALWDRNTTNATPAEPIIVFDGNSIQNGTFPPFLPDGNGGGIYAWYETGGSRRSYAQHIGPNGEEIFGHNGLAAMIHVTGTIDISAGLSYDQATGDIYLASKTTFSANQNNWGLKVAKVTSEGIREWGDDGIEVLPMTPVQTNFERTIARAGGGCDVVWFENATTPPGGRVLAYGLGPTGTALWPAITQVCSLSGSKSRLDIARGTQGNTLVTWADARVDTNNIYAQSVLADGSIGAPTPACTADFNHDGNLNPDDLGDYITCFFTEPPCSDADYNHDTNINPDDLGDFITSFFLGC